jgi:hypothetical protein
VTYTRTGPRARAQPLGFSDAAGTDPSTDAVPVLNHKAVENGLARAHVLHSDEAPDMQVIVVGQLMTRQVLADAKTIHATGTCPCGLGMMQPEGRSQLKGKENK